MTNNCQASGCANTTESSLIMCAAHWRMVPLALQRAVWRANKERGGAGGNALYLPYLDACAQAVEIVALHEMRCPDNSFRRAAVLLEQHLGQTQA